MEGVRFLHLRQKRKTRGSVRTKAVRDVKISKRITIDEKPEEVIGKKVDTQLLVYIRIDSVDRCK